jgi:hydrogenase maturation factor
MCLGIPGKVISVDGSEIVVDCWGTLKTVTSESSVTIVPGDFVIEHEGVIERLISPEDVADTIAMYETILAETLVPA